MYTGYLALAGVELINNSRATAYANAMGVTSIQCTGCTTLPRALGDLPYASPDLDDAPWFDPVEPASKDFAGFFGLEILGLSKSPGAHTVVPLITDGASLHSLRRSHREIQITVMALAKTECALSYGFAWLASALRGGVCNAGCTGDSLCFFTCCPTCDPPPTDGTADTCGNPYYRTLLNCGLLSYSEPTGIKKISGGYLATIVYTIAAGDPFIYRDPILMATGPAPAQQLPNYLDPGVPPACFESIDCLQDDLSCPAPPLPVLPPIPVDACFPTGAFNAARLVVALPKDQVPIWQEKVPLIIIRAGSRRLERITLRWYGNPVDRDCTTDLDPCAACAEFNIAAIPMGATLTIDGRIESAYVDCSGGPGLSTAEPQLYGRGGTPFVWPVFSCADGTCLEIIVRAETMSDDTAIEVYYVVREDAA